MPLNKFKIAALIAASLAISTNAQNDPCEDEPEGVDCQLANSTNSVEQISNEPECTDLCECDAECNQANFEDNAKVIDHDADQEDESP